MALIAIPVDSANSSYDFSIDLDRETYTLSFDYSDRAEQWQMSIYDEGGENLIAGSVPLLVGIILFYQYQNVEGLPPGQFIAIDETGRGQNPSRDNLGIDVKLYYEEALNAVVP